MNDNADPGHCGICDGKIVEPKKGEDPGAYCEDCGAELDI